MKLEDIKLGMEVLISRNRSGEGWTPLSISEAKERIGTTGKVVAIWIPTNKKDTRDYIVDVSVPLGNGKCGNHSFPPSSLEIPVVPIKMTIEDELNSIKEIAILEIARGLLYDYTIDRDFNEIDIAEVDDFIEYAKIYLMNFYTNINWSTKKYGEMIP